MENASKALIIAGAILLSILLISLGIFIFNQAQDTISNSGMSEAEKVSFNNKFTKYEGTQKGSVVKSLMQEVIASNADENNQDAGRTIEVKVKVDTTSTSGISVPGVSTMYKTCIKKDLTVKDTSDIKNTKTYKVSIETYENGCVSVIKID